MKKKEEEKMPSDESQTMYGNPLSEFLMFLIDFIVFAARSIYFLFETFILTVLPNRYRKLKVSVEMERTRVRALIVFVDDTLFASLSIKFNS